MPRMPSLRGLWLGPLLIDRHGYTLVASGHVATAMSLVSLFSPAFFGRMDPAPARAAAGSPASRC